MRNIISYIGIKYMKKKINKEINKDTTINYNLLKKMATTKRLKEIFQKYIENETIPSVRTAWIEYFLELKKKKIKL
jgi:hypothetical protein